ncbi:MAG: spermidine synthase, partial [Firmicutes bacterium]|nr:spermidine synthase [Bacillota bacterium]
FYEAVRRRLDEGGVMVTQSGSVWFQAELVTKVRRGLVEQFGRAWVYWAGVPSYSIGPWTFTGVSLGPDLSRPDPARAARLATRYYSPEVHRAAFELPLFLRERLEG